MEEKPNVKRVKMCDMEEDSNGAAGTIQEPENTPQKKEDEIIVEEQRQPSGTRRSPFSRSHRIRRLGGKYHLVIGVTGSVAAIKLAELIDLLYTQCSKDKLFIKIVATDSGRKFIEKANLNIEEVIYGDEDEWGMWSGRGDPVLHIELRKWADGMLIAPLDANSLAKIANGICDNTLTSLVRAWDPSKPLHYAPAMNTFMWDNPLTVTHRTTLKELLRFKEIPPISKSLMCGDEGMGAMATIQLIASMISADVRNKFAVYTS